MGDRSGSTDWKNIGVLRESWAIQSLLVRVMVGFFGLVWSKEV